MSGHNGLFLHEEILLLALRDEKGTIVSGTMYSYAIGGAVLADLLLNSRVGVEQEKKKKFVKLLDSTPLGDPVIDECLHRIRTSKKRATLQAWVSRFAHAKKLKRRVAEQLCRRGVLRADEGKVLLIFSRKIYPEINPEPEKKLITRLREAVFTDTEEIDPRTVVVVSLANNSGLLKATFGKKMLKDRKKRIEKIVNGEIVGKATAEAIQAMQTAVFVTMFISTY
jgi:hypothetical protein